MLHEQLNLSNFDKNKMQHESIIQDIVAKIWNDARQTRVGWQMRRSRVLHGYNVTSFGSKISWKKMYAMSENIEQPTSEMFIVSVTETRMLKLGREKLLKKKKLQY